MHNLKISGDFFRALAESGAAGSRIDHRYVISHRVERQAVVVADLGDDDVEQPTVHHFVLTVPRQGSKSSSSAPRPVPTSTAGVVPFSMTIASLGSHAVFGLRVGIHLAFEVKRQFSKSRPSQDTPFVRIVGYTLLGFLLAFAVQRV